MADDLGASPAMVLDAKGTAAAAGRLYVRIIELEPGTFERLDVIHFGAIQVQHAGLIDEHLQFPEVVGFVKETRGILEGHRIAKARAPASDDRNSEASRLGFLSGQNLFDLANRNFR